MVDVTEIKHNIIMAVGTKFISVLLTLTGILVMSSDVQASSCPHHITKIPYSNTAVHNHVCYLFVNNELYWSKARDNCWDLGGEMLTIENKETMDFMRKKLDSPELSWDREGVWLGASKAYGRWRWTNGKVMNYSNWASGQPSKLLGLLSVEDCSQMRQDDGWKWHDIPCGSLKFHYNYVCQFPAVDSTTITTIASTTATPSVSPSTETSLYGTHKELSSEEYRRLGEELFHIFSGHASYNILHSNSNHSALNRPGDVAGRVSSSAAGQAEDNGNSAILAIIIGVATGLLLIMGVIALVLHVHNRRNKQKASEVPVHYRNNTYHMSPNQLSHPSSQVPPIPTSQVPYPSNEGLYLDPLETDKPINHFNNVGFAGKGFNCAHHQTGASNSICSSIGADSELGACGGSDPERELKVPLMAAANKTNCQLNGTNCTTCDSLQSFGSLSQGEYIEMNSQGGQETETGGRVKMADEKHTYSNVDHRDSGIENVYEVLP